MFLSVGDISKERSKKLAEAHSENEVIGNVVRGERRGILYRERNIIAREEYCGERGIL